ncbi:hypothetical protein CUMW_272500, partial [Citrus unshiu]
SLLELNYSLLITVLQKQAEIVSDLTNMETPCTGKNEWSECLVLFIIFSIADDEKMNDNNLDLLVVPQYGRYPDYAG